MALSSGTQVGVFEIAGKLGAGGMGEVYRARDTKLGRDVAIKTLPASLAGDADRLARFEREATLLASLNHANIASVYNLDEHDGTLYIAMELVEGETLEEKLKQGAVSVDEALGLALQIAQALEAAHDKGVVHRDLKPANIMLTPDGVVKVLDFGLAKAFSGDPSEASPAHSPALSMAMTQQGLILGTAGYMSPEQASGQATDQRADVWAFGVVVYEMLTGMPVFHGESVPHILAAVLQLEPDWSRLPPKLNPRIRFMLERCLTKKPRNRYAGIADARADIEAVIQDPAGASLVAADAVSQASAWTAARIAAAAGIIVAVAAVSAGAVWLGMTPEVESPRVTRFNVEPPVDAATMRRANGRLVAISPDGRRLAINTTEGIYIRELDELETRLVPGSEEANSTGPFFTPDGLSLNFGGGGGVRRMSIDGGPIVAAGRGIVSGDGNCGMAGPPEFFVDDDTRLIFCLRPPRGLNLVSDDGSQELLLPWEEEETVFGYPWLLPGGEHALLSSRPGPAARWDDGEIRVVSLDSGESQVLIQGGIGRYLPTGHIVFVRDDVLYGVAFDPETLAVTSAEEPLVADLHRPRNSEASFSISNNGTLAYVADRAGAAAFDAVQSLLGSTRLERVSGDGSVALFEADGRFIVQPRLSPDGRRLAAVIFGIDDTGGANYSIGVYDLERGGARVPLVTGVQAGPSYLWMPDGESIVYFGVGDTGPAILSRRADGSGAAITLWSAAADMDVASGVLRAITPDGTVALFDGIASGDDTSALYRLTLAEGSEPELLLGGPANLHDAALSPDGRWLAYASDESGVDQVFVVPYPQVDGYRVAVSTGGGSEPAWDPTANRLYFRSGNDLLGADYETEPRFSAGVPSTVIAGSFLPFGDVSLNRLLQVPTYAVLPANAGFVLSRLDEGGDDNASPLEIIVVENWFEELKRRIPVD